MTDTQKAQERAQEVLDSYADTLDGYGYEHMGDMWRDMRPMAEDVLALAARVEELEGALRGIANNLHFVGDEADPEGCPGCIAQAALTRAPQAKPRSAA